MSVTDIESNYTFATKPFKHQLDAFRISKDREEFALLMDLGTGKSKVAIDTMAYLYEQGKIRGAVVVTNKGVYRNWSDKEIPQHLPARVPYRIGIWDSGGTMEEKRSLSPFEAYSGKREELLILVMNVEAFSGKRAAVFAWKFMKACPSIIILDESTSIKTHNSQRTKHLVKLAPFAKYRRIMSGEPAANSPMNLYSQFEFLKHGILGCESFYAFRATYAHLLKQNMGGRNFLTITGYKNLEDLQEKLKPVSFIIKKSDCLDLPPKVFETRHVTLGKQQRAAYDAMTRESIVFIEHVLAYGKPAKELPPVKADMDFEELQDAGIVEQGIQASKMSTAQIVLTQLMRLQQILCGFLVSDTGVIVPFDEPNPRLQALFDVIAETQDKVVIWSLFKHNTREIAGALKKAYGEESVGTYYGETPMDERRRVLREFQDPASRLRFFVGSQSAAGYGITLTASATEVFYSNSFCAEKRNQSVDRLHRISQTRSVTVIDLVTPKTIDVEILTALQKKTSLSQLITASNWKKIVMAEEDTLLKAA